MLNVYDIAHDLARSLKETDQFKNYEALKKEIDANESLKNMIDDFQNKNMEMNSFLMSGAQPDEELVNQIKSLYGIVMSDPKAAAYMQSQMALSQILTDIYQIIGEAVNV